MKVAHIIMAHKNPDQLERLVKKLIHPDFDIYIHIDAKVNIDEFKTLTGIKNLFFINSRTRCNWGGFSLIKGVINCLNEVLFKSKKYDFINLMSGQDYPLYSAQYCRDYLKKNEGTIFLSYENHSESEWWKSASSRYERYHFTDYKFKGRYLIEKIVNIILPKRKFPNDMTLFGGSKSCWWTLTSESAEYLVSRLKYDRKLINYLKFCWGPDEFIITTLIMNSAFKNRVVNNNLRFIDWSEGNAHPKILSIDDESEILKSKMLFARKFDINIDYKILDKIDMERIL